VRSFFGTRFETRAEVGIVVGTPDFGGAELARVGRLCFPVTAGLAAPMMLILSLIAVAAEPPVQLDPHTVRLPVIEGKDLRFAHLSPADGLSHTRVSQIVQDDQGFLWFGAVYALNRYDGYKFKVFEHDPRQPNSIGGNLLSALFKDRSGMIWVASNRFVDRLDPTTEKFTHYQVGPDDPAETVLHISQDRAGMLWLATGTGLHRLDPTTGQIRHYRSGLISHNIQWTGEDSSGTFWVGTNEGLDRFDRAAGKVTLHIPIQQASSPAFYEDRSGTFWIYNQTGNGLATFDKKTNRVVQYSFYPKDPPSGGFTGVFSMLEDRHRNLWIGSPALGLLRLDPERRSFVRYRHDPADPNSVGEDRVIALAEDREGNIWAGLDGHGPDHFTVDPTPFETFRSGPGANDLTRDLVIAIYADHDGTVWVGNADGLNRIDRKSGRLERWTAGLNPQPMVTAITEDRLGHLWAGTWGHGLIRFDDRNKFKIFRHVDGDPSSLSSNLTFRLFIDHAGTLWVATSDGLNRFDPRTEKFTVFKADWNNSLSQNYVSIGEDPTRNALWLGSVHSGLHRWDMATGRVRIYRSNPASLDALPDDLGPQIHVSGSGVVWATTQNGLANFNPTSGTFTNYAVKVGLATCILEDDRGALWMSTNAGLSRFDPKTRSFTSYSTADGLPGNDFSGWGACYKSPNGEMFFGGYSGGVAFYPSRLATVPSIAYVPPVALTEFRLSGNPVEVGDHSPLDKTISHTSRLRLSHEQNTFSLGFSALSYRNPATNRYRYKLEPLENTWHEVGSDERLATYTTLPAKAYTFRVQAAASRGAWSEPGVKLQIEILPPLWKTAWFEGLCGALVLTLVWGLYRLRLYQLAREFQAQVDGRVDERMRVARELHDTLLQSCQASLIQMQAARDLFSRRPEQAVRNLDDAISMASGAIAEGRGAIQELRSQPPLQDDLVKVLTAAGQDLAARSQELKEHPARFRVVVDGEQQPLQPFLQDEVYRIARELIRNAFQHAEAAQIEAEIRYDPNLLRVNVRDDGKGIPPDILKSGGREGHWGLTGIRERAKRIGAQVDFWSKAGVGMEVQLTVPGSIAYQGNDEESRSRLIRRKSVSS
jgi:signal transduction histidine kinase/ligand-binding sensor domain-containing protein